MNKFAIMSHTLTETQVNDITKQFNIENIIYLPEQLKEIWGNIPPEGPWDAGGRHISQLNVLGPVLSILSDDYLLAEEVCRETAICMNCKANLRCFG